MAFVEGGIPEPLENDPEIEAGSGQEVPEIPGPRSFVILQEDGSLDFGYTIGTLDLDFTEGDKSCEVAAIAVIDGKLLVAVPETLWSKSVQKRRLGSRALAKPNLVAVASCLEDSREAEEDIVVQLRVWVGFLHPELEKNLEFIGPGDADFPFGEHEGQRTVPFGPALVEVANDHFNFMTAESAVVPESSQPSDSTARLDHLEAMMRDMKSGLDALLGQATGGATLLPAAQVWTESLLEGSTRSPRRCTWDSPSSTWSGLVALPHSSFHQQCFQLVFLGLVGSKSASYLGELEQGLLHGSDLCNPPPSPGPSLSSSAPGGKSSSDSERGPPWTSRRPRGTSSSRFGRSFMIFPTSQRWAAGIPACNAFWTVDGSRPRKASWRRLPLSSPPWATAATCFLREGRVGGCGPESLQLFTSAKHGHMFSLTHPLLYAQTLLFLCPTWKALSPCHDGHHGVCHMTSKVTKRGCRRTAHGRQNHQTVSKTEGAETHLHVVVVVYIHL